MKVINVKIILFYLLYSVILVIALSSCDGIFPTQTKPPVPSDHTDNISGAFHRPEPKSADGCTDCHGSDLHGGLAEINGQLVYANSCYQCHGALWENGGGGGLIKEKIIK